MATTKKTSFPLCQDLKEKDPDTLKSLIVRLNRIEGQIRGIRNMVEKGAYCPNVLVQTSAVSAAINGFNKALLEAHIRTCAAGDIESGDADVIKEMITTLQHLVK